MNRKFYQKWNAFYSKVSLRYVIWGAFTLTALLGAVLMGTSFYNRFSLQLQGIVEKQNRALIEQVNNTLTSELRNIMRISDSLYFSVLKSEENVPVEEGFALLYDTNKSSIQNIALFSKEGDLLVSAPAAKLKPGVDVTKEAWFQNAVTQTENQHFSRPHVQNLFVNSKGNYAHVLTLSRMVQVPDAYEVQDGVLLIDLKYEQLESIFKNVSLGEEGYIYLVDGAGNLIYHPQQQLILDGIEQENHEKASAYKDGGHDEVFEGQHRKVTIKSVGYTGWKIVGVVSDKAAQLSTVKNIIFLIALVMSFMLILSIINSYISKKVTIPIEHLEGAVKRIAEGDLETTIEERGAYEISHLGRSIRKMKVRIKKLMEDIVREQEIQRKNELDTLQSQINPHFLYNTLDIVVWMVENEKPQDAVRALTALARFFRIGLSKGKTIITVRDEIEHVKNYLTIQKMRYKNKFEYYFEVEEEVLELSTLKLILQPIVENAVAYGMEFQDGDGEVFIKAYLKEEKLIFQVVDNGPGIMPERLEEIRAGKVVSSKKGSGIGMRNVGERIQLAYGKEYGIQIESEPDEGTCITLTQPKIAYGQEGELL